MMFHTNLFVALVVIVTFPPVISESPSPSAYPACCSYPCKNRGICLDGYHNISSYVCDCSNTGHTGKQCEMPTWYTWFVGMFKPSKAASHYLLTGWLFRPLVKILHKFPIIYDRLLLMVILDKTKNFDSFGRYDSDHTYINYDAALNRSLHGRILPPVADNCPTPLGIVGAKKLPPVESILPLFERKKFKPEPIGSNALFPFFAQFFTHQFLRSHRTQGAKYTTAWAHQIDLTQLYGNDLIRQRTLRTLIDGKMKMQVINGMTWPPYVKDVNVSMYQFRGPPEKNFALGHPFLAIMPGLLMLSTVWLREHNRVASIMKQTYPAWDDERLFQTTRLILLGEMTKIVIEEYIQHLSNYNVQLKFKPEILFGKSFQYQSKIPAEYNLVYRWHALVPDYFVIDGVNYTLYDFVGNQDVVPKHGVKAFVETLVKTRAGKVTFGNHNYVVLPVMKKNIETGRELKFQSFNNYRRHFGLHAYTSFEEMVGEDEVELVDTLKRLYGNVEAMELVPGAYLEKLKVRGLFGELIVEIGGSVSFPSILSNKICSPKFWRPSTFGGDVGFDIVKTATLSKLFCNNMKDGDPCPYIGFKVPPEGTDGSKNEL